LRLKSTGVDLELVDKIIGYLGIANREPAGIELLNALVTAYTQRVPWESASRIVKKSRIRQEQGGCSDGDCARWPDEFWRDAMELGTGGTCFESNYAFVALLQVLGFDGYLTVNNMEPTVGCHSAIVTVIKGRQWLVDVGFPLYVPLPLDPGRPTQREGVFHQYRVLPGSSDSFKVERSHHPQSYCFTLINRPVPEPAYRRVLGDDYGLQGLFLDRVIVNKVIDGHVCRFNGGELPFKLERFRRNYADSRQLDRNPSVEIARYFALDGQLVRRALTATTVNQ